MFREWTGMVYAAAAVLFVYVFIKVGKKFIRVLLILGWLAWLVLKVLPSLI